MKRLTNTKQMDAFDDIRPYTDSEMVQAMHRIVESEYFPLLAGFIFPDLPVSAVKDRVLSYRTVREFQHDTMYQLNLQIISRSTAGLACDGLDKLSPEGHYLFVSNHRDIMLDSCLLQYLLVAGGLETTQITFGANLMTNPLVVDIGKSNKMFRVERPGGSIREFYKSSLHLSSYIRKVLVQDGESLWIAQRNGRTKDGRDATDQGIIKMFSMSGGKDRVAALAELNIVPVAVSYEWEPCDGAKALELLKSRTAKYEKAPGEDLQSILSGIISHKGHVCINICDPLTADDIAACGADGVSDADFHKAVATLIDSRITPAYELYPNNYIARDILEGRAASPQYTDAQKQVFEEHLGKAVAAAGVSGADEDEFRKIFLGIYANPVYKAESGLKARIRSLIEEALPLVDPDSSFLFAELDSLGLMSILMALSGEFGIELSATDATPRNLMNLDSIVAMVERKQAAK